MSGEPWSELPAAPYFVNQWTKIERLQHELSACQEQLRVTQERCDIREGERDNFRNALQSANEQLARYTAAEKELPGEPQMVWRVRHLPERLMGEQACIAYIDALRDYAIAQTARVKELELHEAYHVEAERALDGLKKIAEAERDAAVMQVGDLQTMFGLARTLCLVNGCKAEVFDAAIDAAIKAEGEKHD